MKYLGSLVLVVTLFASAQIASGESNYSFGWSKETADEILTFLPIAVFLLIIFFFLRQQRNSPSARQQQEYIERHTLHMQRLEQALERIAISIEQRNK